MCRYLFLFGYFKILWSTHGVHICVCVSFSVWKYEKNQKCEWWKNMHMYKYVCRHFLSDIINSCHWLSLKHFWTKRMYVCMYMWTSEATISFIHRRPFSPQEFRHLNWSKKIFFDSAVNFSSLIRAEERKLLHFKFVNWCLNEAGGLGLFG
jgi:hypothetical protein